MRVNFYTLQHAYTNTQYLHTFSGKKNGRSSPCIFCLPGEFIKHSPCLSPSSCPPYAAVSLLPSFPFCLFRRKL